MTPENGVIVEPKAYAKAQVNEVMSFAKFCKHIADHNGVYSRGTVRGVISDMCECLVEQLLNGNKILLGELGNFSVSLRSTGATTLSDFKSTNIKEVNILFTPGDDFDNLIDRAEFTAVSSRAAQAATLAAEKAGEGTVDLAAAKKKKAVVKSDDASNADHASDTGSTDTGGDNQGSADFV